MTELEAITGAFYLLEKDSDVWDTADSEYVTARGFLNMGIRRWEKYDNTTWKELWTDLATASTGQETTSTAVFNYDTPTDFVRPGGYVTTTSSDGVITFWRVIPNEDVGKYADNTGNFVYFYGNKNSGIDLRFNPKATVPVGATINYPYYKSATTSSASSTVLEMSDPNYLSYMIASHMSESTDAIDNTFFTLAEGILRQMKSVNNSGVWGTPFNIDSDLENMDGFGTGGGWGPSSSNPTNR